MMLTSSGIQALNMKRCVNLPMFNAEMAHISPDNKYVIISVIENVLEDVIKTAQNDSPEDGSAEMKDDRSMEAAGLSIKEFIEIIDTVGKACPSTLFAIIAPLTRTALEWYSENHCIIIHKMKEVVEGMENSNVTFVNCMAVESQFFDWKRVHLTPGSGTMFIRSLLKASEAAFFLEDHDNSKEEVMEITNGDDDDLEELRQGSEDTQRNNAWAADLSSYNLRPE